MSSQRFKYTPDHAVASPELARAVDDAIDSLHALRDASAGDAPMTDPDPTAVAAFLLEQAEGDERGDRAVWRPGYFSDTYGQPVAEDQRAA